jgi:DNA polymerase-1
VRAFLAGLPAGVRVGLHVRGFWGKGTGDANGLGIAAESPLEGEPSTDAAFVDLTVLDPDDEAALGAWLADGAVAKAMHDAKGPLLALHARGWSVAGLTSDTALAAYLALPGQGVFDLADLALRFLRRELRAEATPDGQLSFDGAEEDAGAADAAVRARAVADLAVALDQDLERRGGTALLRDLELPLVDVLADCERTGIAADVDHLAALEGRLREQVKEAARRRTTPSATSSTSARPSSCRRCCSTSSACRRPRRSRPATRPTPTRCRTSSARTRSSRRCCCTAR